MELIPLQEEASYLPRVPLIELPRLDPLPRLTTEWFWQHDKSIDIGSAITGCLTNVDVDAFAELIPDIKELYEGVTKAKDTHGKPIATPKVFEVPPKYHIVSSDGVIFSRVSSREKIMEMFDRRNYEQSAAKATELVAVDIELGLIGILGDKYYIEHPQLGHVSIIQAESMRRMAALLE